MKLVTNGNPVYLSRSTRAGHLTAVLGLIALPIGLFFYGWYFQDTVTMLWLTAFGIFAGGFTLLFVRKARILRFDSAPAFVIRSDGIELSSGNVLPWMVLKDAVVFTYEGDKIIGLRLREELDQWKRSEIEARVAHSPGWQIFGMPLTIDFSSLSISGQELLIQLQNHGLKVTAVEKEICLGDESQLR